MYQCQQFIFNFVDNLHTSNSRNQAPKNGTVRVSFKDGSLAVITTTNGYYKSALCYDPNGKVVS